MLCAKHSTQRVLGREGSLIEESSMHRYIYITVHIKEGRNEGSRRVWVCVSRVLINMFRMLLDSRLRRFNQRNVKRAALM